MPRAPSQEMGSKKWEGQLVSLLIVLRHLQQHELSARRSWLWLTLTLNHRLGRLHRCVKRWTWIQKWRDIVFSTEFLFYLQHHDSRIIGRWHHGRYTLLAYIQHCHASPSRKVIAGGSYWIYVAVTSYYNFGTLNSSRYISLLLKPVALSFIQVLQNTTFQHINAWPYVDDIVRTFLGTESI